MKLSEFVGNEPLKNQLGREISDGRLHHAYLLLGPSGSGKKTLAKIIAAAMECQKEDKPCGECPQCRKVISENHPDVVWIRKEEGKRQVNVSAARDFRKDAFIMPNEGKRKVFIIEDDMNNQAQNAILKLLEEGPSYASFLILAENEAKILTTIKSRCESVTVNPVSPAQVRDFLIKSRPGEDPAKIEAVSQRCDGNIGRALALMDGDGGEEAREMASSLMNTIISGDELERMKILTATDKWSREEMSYMLSELQDLVVEKAKSENTGRTERQKMCAAADTISKMQDALTFNVSPSTVSGWLCAQLQK